MNDGLRQSIGKRLNRVAGQVAGLQKMVDTDRYCPDVLTQIAAIRSALHSVGVEVLAGHVQHCIVDKQQDGGSKPTEALIEELRNSLARFSK